MGGGIAAQKAAALAGSPLAADLSLPIEQDVERRLKYRFKPSYLDVTDQGGNCGAAKVCVLMVSEAFQGMSRIDRQREVQALLREDLDSNGGRIHALSQKLLTPEEYAKVAPAA